MVKAQYAILAEYVREGTNGKVDVLGVFDRIFTRAVPAQHPRAVLLFLLVVDSEDDLGKKKAIRLSLRAPSGQIMFEQRGEVELKPQAGTWLASARLVFELANMPVPEYGKYLFQLELDDSIVAAHPFTVAKAPLANTPA